MSWITKPLEISYSKSVKAKPWQSGLYWALTLTIFLILIIFYAGEGKTITVSKNNYESGCSPEPINLEALVVAAHQFRVGSNCTQSVLGFSRSADIISFTWQVVPVGRNQKLFSFAVSYSDIMGTSLVLRPSTLANISQYVEPLGKGGAVKCETFPSSCIDDPSATYSSGFGPENITISNLFDTQLFSTIHDKDAVDAIRADIQSQLAVEIYNLCLLGEDAISFSCEVVIEPTFFQVCVIALTVASSAQGFMLILFSILYGPDPESSAKADLTLNHGLEKEQSSSEQKKPEKYPLDQRTVRFQDDDRTESKGHQYIRMTSTAKTEAAEGKRRRKESELATSFTTARSSIPASFNTENPYEPVRWDNLT
mmetsp:Transcript_26673/g.42890  ORF Transcript_26673/g.42890 Transcript_26673/m.42890 type:complete len:368 (-) Transcript_26673:365-1468(-)